MNAPNSLTPAQQLEAKIREVVRQELATILAPMQKNVEALVLNRIQDLFGPTAAPVEAPKKQRGRPPRKPAAVVPGAGATVVAPNGGAR